MRGLPVELHVILMQCYHRRLALFHWEILAGEIEQRSQGWVTAAGWRREVSLHVVCDC